MSGARFSPDGRTIVYSAAWGGKPSEIFLTRRESSDSRSLGFPGAHLWSVSSGAELALANGWLWDGPDVGVGTLARASLLGGEARQLIEGVEDADWSPDGKSLAVVRRRAAGKNVPYLRRALEFPIGRTLYEQEGGPFWGIRVSPKGNLVAFIDQTRNVVTEVSVVDTSGRKRTLSTGWFRAQGVSWSHDGREVWFTAAKAGSTARALWAVTLSGRERLVTEVPGRLRLEDISEDGRVLLAHETVRREMVGLAPGETRERDLTWLGYSFPENLSSDGRTLLFTEASEGSGLAAFYVRGTDGSPPIRIGTGEKPLLSPDGKWVVAWKPAPGAKVGPEGPLWELLPTGAGESRPFRVEGLAIFAVVWFPDGKHLLVRGEAPGKKHRDYVVDLDGKNPRPLTPEGVFEAVISPDGKRLAARDENGGFSIYPVDGGQAHRVAEATPDDDDPVQWAADGKSIYLYHQGIPGRLGKLDLATGRRQPWKEFLPADPTGVLLVQPLLVTPEGNSYVYTYIRVLSDLYVVEGLK